MVQKPGPTTLRYQVAITKVEESMVVLHVVPSVVPQARALSTVKGLATGKPAFVGEASIEAKITDAQTGKLLAAVADRRVGGKKFDSAIQENGVRSLDLISAVAFGIGHRWRDPYGLSLPARSTM